MCRYHYRQASTSQSYVPYLSNLSACRSKSVELGFTRCTVTFIRYLVPTQFLFLVKIRLFLHIYRIPIPRYIMQRQHHQIIFSCLKNSKRLGTYQIINFVSYVTHCQVQVRPVGKSNSGRQTSSFTGALGMISIVTAPNSQITQSHHGPTADPLGFPVSWVGSTPHQPQAPCYECTT